MPNTGYSWFGDKHLVPWGYQFLPLGQLSANFVLSLYGNVNNYVLFCSKYLLIYPKKCGIKPKIKAEKNSYNKHYLKKKLRKLLVSFVLLAKL